MSEQQAISTVLEVLKLIVSGGIGATIIGIIGKLFVDRKLQNQKDEYNKQLELLKSKLDKKNTVHKLQFEKEFQLYGELWKALVDVRSTATITPSLDIMPKDKSSIEIYKERTERAFEAFYKANALFIYNRPFYHDDVSKITDGLLNQCLKHINRVARVLSSEKFDDKMFEKADELFEIMQKTVNDIEAAIKRRIGLLQEAEIVE